MKSIEVPDWLNDIYRDMRDRRLLLPALALIIAAVAIPIVLKADPPPATPPAPAFDSGEATAAEAAVLVEQTGIRDYRSRLAALKERNPFESTLPAPKPQGAGADAASSDSPAGSGVDTGTAAPVESGGSPSTDASAAGGSVPDTSPVYDEPADVDVPTSEPIDDVKPEVRFFADRADVSIGKIGKGKTLEGVQPLELLPDDNAPVVVFVGRAPEGQGAVFNLSPDVIETSGDGSCAPKKPHPCQFLTLKPGEEAYLKYGLKGTETYRLKLIDSYVVRVSDPRED